MVAVVTAAMALFGGRDLDSWKSLSGDWAVVESAVACRKAPAAIRSVYESEHYRLEFAYRHSAAKRARVFVHSKMSTGGQGLWLTPEGLSDHEVATVGGGEDQWVSAVVDVAPGHLGWESKRADGAPLAKRESSWQEGSRGFIRFESAEPGLEIREVRVSEPGFAMMFKDDSLDGWEIVRPADPDHPAWVNEHGVVSCRPRRSSWLRTLRTHDDFVLRLEYLLPPRGNSGVYLRAPVEGRVSRIGLEIQLLDDAAFRGKVKPAQLTGSIYDGIAPEVQVPCPANEWNALEVRCKGKQIRTILNGIRLYEAELDDAKKDTNSDQRPLATRRTVGFIGLQDHSAPVKFRNVRIQDLK